MNTDREARIRALELASNYQEPADLVVQRADAYLAFLTGAEAKNTKAKQSADPDLIEAKRCAKEWLLDASDESVVQVIAWAIKRGRELAK